MSNLKYFNDPGTGQHLSNMSHYSQAVVIPGKPNVIKISGQGGWDPNDHSIDHPNLESHINQAFKNVDLVLRTAGSNVGWEGVYRVLMFYTETDDNELLPVIGDCMRQWCPNHRPVLTAIPVQRLALQAMKIEVEVEAYDELPSNERL